MSTDQQQQQKDKIQQPSAKPPAGQAAQQTDAPAPKKKTPEEIEADAIRKAEAELRKMINAKYGDQSVTARFSSLWDIRPGLCGIIVTALTPNRTLTDFALSYSDIDETKLLALLKFRKKKLEKYSFETPSQG